MNASASTLEQENQGRYMVIAGLLIQLATFCIFIMLAIVFYARMRQAPTMTSETLNTSWKRHIVLMVMACDLILARSIFRLVEYICDSDGPLMEKEIFTILLDSVLMFLCMLLFNLFHPSQALNENSDHPTEIPILDKRDKGLMSSSSSQDGQP